MRGNELIEKRNVLNEIRSNRMTLQELRLFSIYLSKINPRDLETRAVVFQIEDFCKIMGMGRFNVKQLKASAENLMCKPVTIPDEDGGFNCFPLFKRSRLFKDKDNQWKMEINASDDALPLMFDFKERYFTYELWNALRLKSANQIRMYEILKQYEKLGRREIEVSTLREYLGIAEDDYIRWDNFKRKVLDVCQKALRETTDIKFTYERGQVGAGGKWLSVIFHIYKNEDYTDQLTLYEFLDSSPNVVVTTENEEHEIDLDTVNCYRQYDFSKVSDNGIMHFDKEAQYYYPSYPLEERALLFNGLLCKAVELTKEPIKNYDSYMITCLKNEWNRE